MGGYGSGRSTARPTAEMSYRIDLNWMIRTGQARPGHWLSGSLSWECRSERSGSINYSADMRDELNSVLHLSFCVGPQSNRQAVQQRVQLTFTEPNFGGRRWWMACPHSGLRVAKLYMPPGATVFASRKAWDLGYYSQRVAHKDRTFEKICRLQKKLGCEQGMWFGLQRPKGMHGSTFQRHLERYQELDRDCTMEMAQFLGLDVTQQGHF